jgi:amino acid transporter
MATNGTSLARGAIGLREVLFQSVTSMAPAGAVALSIAAGATYAGGALPLAVLLALVACMLVASGQLAKHLPSAGSIYTYPAEAIHPALGFLVGWGYALVEALIGPITMILCGYLIGSITNSEFGWPFTATWVIFMIVASVLIAALNYRGIRVSARTGTILGSFEILVFLALASRMLPAVLSLQPLQLRTAGHTKLPQQADRRYA